MEIMENRAQQQTEILATIGVRALSDLGAVTFLPEKIT